MTVREKTNTEFAQSLREEASMWPHAKPTIQGHQMSSKKKPGRKPRGGPREPRGRLSRKAGDKQVHRSVDEQSAMQVAKEARQRMFGVSEADSATELAGTVPGRLLLTKEIVRFQYDASVAFGTAHARYLRAIDAPPGPRAVEIGRASGRNLNGDMTKEQCERAIAQWDAAKRVLVEANYYHPGSIYAACEQFELRNQFFPHMLGDYRVGMNALARHYGLLPVRVAA